MTRNTISRSGPELAEHLLQMTVTPGETPVAPSTLWKYAIIPPWELTRARKVLPLLFASKITEAGQTPGGKMADSSRYDGWSRFQTRGGDPSSYLLGFELERLFQTTPLARLLFAYMDGYLKTWDRNEVGRRALTQVLALRLWQVRHDGHLPGALAELVPSILDELPPDPYAVLDVTNPYFGYVRSSGQPLLPLGDFEPLGVQPFPARTRPVPDSWLLYSVGADLRDDGAKVNDSSYLAKGDIIFPLPERNHMPRR
jgi:hypothetical protein